MTLHAVTSAAARSEPSHAEMANAIRFLAIDAVERARSGHPGMPMGMADVATVLFSRFLKFDASDPAWPDRDRFVLSAGHGSMLLYALLHLTGYAGVTADELKNFRQWGSKTPGHPEYGHTPGVETTTGPLGQGIATAVGMALAERIMNARFGDDLVEVHNHVLEQWREIGVRGQVQRHRWIERTRHVDVAHSPFHDALNRKLPGEYLTAMAAIRSDFGNRRVSLATRQASQQVLEAIAVSLPGLLGGSADLTHSNLTRATSQRPLRPGSYAGEYVHYGIREHAMAAAMNGIALHGGFIPYGGTFLSFADYSRPAIRLAALMRIRVIHVMTHDSIGLGEDGPTHQPVEHLAALRAIPGLLVFRPGDAVETAEAWDCALRAVSDPSVLCLSRQAVPTFRDAEDDVNRVAYGAYVVVEPEAGRDVTLVATGSEVAIALDAAQLLARDNVRAAVVSAPCFDLFRRQSPEYRTAVLGRAPRIGIEAAVEGDWARWIGDDGEFVGMTGFGASAPAEVLYREFGITAETVARTALQCMARSRMAKTYA